MTSDEHTALIEKLRQVAVCVYLAAEEDAARDISETCLRAAEQLEALSASLTAAEEHVRFWERAGLATALAATDAKLRDVEGLVDAALARAES